MEFQLLIKTKMLKNIGISCFKLSVDVFFLLANVKMLTTVGIFNIYEQDKFLAQLS